MRNELWEVEENDPTVHLRSNGSRKSTDMQLANGRALFFPGSGEYI